MPTTVQRPFRTIKATPQKYVPLAVDVRENEEAEFIAANFPRARKAYRGITAKKLSVARHTGGDLHGVCELIRGNPDLAQKIASYVQGVADEVTNTTTLCFRTVLRAEQQSDCAEDLAQMEILTDNVKPNALLAYIASCNNVIAATRVARTAASIRLREVSK